MDVALKRKHVYIQYFMLFFEFSNISEVNFTQIILKKLQNTKYSMDFPAPGFKKPLTCTKLIMFEY